MPKAISMNGKVLEYLLKPIDVEKIVNEMEEWETAIRSNKPEQTGAVHQDVIFENVHINNKKYLKR